MLHISFRSRLTWAAALLTVVALGAADSAFAAASPAATRMLSSELPSGVSPSKATFKQATAALQGAVAKDHKMAAKLVEAAFDMKSNKYTLECAQIRALVKTAAGAAPEQSRAINEMASALRPDCADGLNDDITAPRTGGIIGNVGDQPTLEAQGFGAGLGAGFAGSPGFIGSAPSGASVTFPTIPNNPVTSVTNP